MNTNEENRYALAKKEILDFLHKLKIPKEKYNLTEQPPFGGMDRFTVFLSNGVDGISIMKVVEHKFRYSRFDDKEYYINEGTIIYFWVRKIRGVNWDDYR